MANDLVYHLLVGAIIVVAFYLSARIARALLGFIGHRLLRRTATVLDDRILDVVLRHVRPLMIIVGLHLGVRETRKGTTAADLTADQILDYAESLLYIAVVILVVKILLEAIRQVIHWYLDKISAAGSVSLKTTMGPLANKVINILVGMVALIIVMDHFGISIGSLLVSLGVGSLAVALAAQDTLANMIAGFVILADRPFRVGDRIELENGMIGDVQEIGLRSTKILNFDNNLIIVPNADLVKGRIVNYAYPFNQMRLRLVVGVAYGSDPARVRKILLGLADAHPDVLKDPAPEVHFTSLGESAIEFTLIARVAEFSRRFATETFLREQAYLAFASEGIAIPFPQRVVHMKAQA